LAHKNSFIASNSSSFPAPHAGLYTDTLCFIARRHDNITSDEHHLATERRIPEDFTRRKKRIAVDVSVDVSGGFEEHDFRKFRGLDSPLEGWHEVPGWVKGAKVLQEKL